MKPENDLRATKAERVLTHRQNPLFLASWPYAVRNWTGFSANRQNPSVASPKSKLWVLLHAIETHRLDDRSRVDEFERQRHRSD